MRVRCADKATCPSPRCCTAAALLAALLAAPAAA
jgi:hypothetical protein